MFFDHDFSKVYYSYRNNPNLYYRAFTPDSRFFENDEFVAEEQGDIPWVTCRVWMSLTGSCTSPAPMAGFTVPVSTAQPLCPVPLNRSSGQGVDGRDRDNAFLAFLGDGAPVGDSGEAEFEFDSSGSQTTGRFRRFEFPVTAGEATVVRLEWADSTARLNVFIRDANNNLATFDNTPANSPKWLTVPAGVGGTYVAAVLVREGSTPYSLHVNPDENPPEAAAEVEFSSSGSATSGAWQVFRFDVEAGEQVVAQVIWDDPDAAIDVFLRDESNFQVDRDVDGSGSPASLSATAQSGGRWSVAVKINGGRRRKFDVLVETSE